MSRRIQQNTPVHICETERVETFVSSGHLRKEPVWLLREQKEGCSEKAKQKWFEWSEKSHYAPSKYTICLVCFCVCVKSTG